jgi:hypothetical protein
MTVAETGSQLIDRIQPSMVFERWQEVIKLGKMADAVIIGLQVNLTAT